MIQNQTLIYNHLQALDIDLRKTGSLFLIASSKWLDDVLPHYSSVILPLFFHYSLCLLLSSSSTHQEIMMLWIWVTCSMVSPEWSSLSEDVEDQLENWESRSVSKTVNTEILNRFIVISENSRSWVQFCL